MDGSEPSKTALRWAVEQARVDGGAVDAVLAWESPTSWYGLTPPSDEEMRTYASRAQEVLDQAVE
ncbi:universal stress protein, partial [[Kitasatospora] papulosa]|uniref:universal stress protein n=1 Tax=[Kitasatospora] papulosa TaxID=1464011 RepID=UPI00403CA5F2